MQRPLIWSSKNAVFAIEPDTGALRWRLNLERVRRMFPMGNRLYILAKDGVACVDEGSGTVIGMVPLEFEPTAGIAAGDRLFVAGTNGAACLDANGKVLWRAQHAFAPGLSLQATFVCTGPNGEALWQQDVDNVSRYDHPGLVLGEQAAQPDIDSQ